MKSLKERKEKIFLPYYKKQKEKEKIIDQKERLRKEHVIIHCVVSNFA